MSADSVDEVDTEYTAEFLRNIFSNESLRDVKLVAKLDGREFAVHRLVMVSSSEYFKALLGPNFKEGHDEKVPIFNVDGPTLELIIQFCYTGQIQITDRNVMQMVTAASGMEFVRIEKKCEQFWNANISTENCLDIFLAADSYSFQDLRKRAIEFICEHFESVAVNELKELEFKHFAEIIQCDRIPVLEEFIFERMMQWVSHDAQDRSEHAADLLKSIKLEKIPLPFLIDTAEYFARKYNCSDILTSEYRRRAESDGKSSGPYRHLTTNAKNIYSVSGRKDEIIQVHKYNQISDRWELFENIKVPGISKKTLFGISLDRNKIFLIGGKNGANFTNSVDTYILDSLQNLGRNEISEARGHIKPIVLNDGILIFGGWCGSLLGTCERLSLETMTAELIEPMQYGRFDYSATIMGGEIYVAGGKANQELILYSVECYDPVKNNWTKVSNMKYPRTDFALVELNGMLYAMGHHKSIEQYDPVRDVWTEIGSFEGSETIKSAVNLHNEIYVLMGDGTFGKLKTEPECSIRPLRSVRTASTIDFGLFVD